MKRWMKNIRKIKDSNEMVSEIVGTVLLFGIVIGIFSTIYVSVVSYPTPSPSTYVNLVGTVEGNNIIIEHRGGEALSLNTKVTITIGDKTSTIIIGEKNYLDNEAKKDKQWNVGERVVFPFEYNLSHREAQITAVDKNSNSLVMIGTLDITPESDVGIKVTVDNKSPKIGTNIVFTITVTNYRGDMNTTSIVVQYILPNGLTHKSNSSTQGTYNRNTGNWNVGELEVSKSATLKITAEVNAVATGDTPTQLAMLLDGSLSIDPKDWDIMVKGLAGAIKNASCFPHDSSVELTVIQFGGPKKKNPRAHSWAQLELGPVLISEINYESKANYIENIKQLKGQTAMSCAFNLAADIISGDPNGYLIGTDWEGNISTNTHFPRQIINVVTDGQPNVLCNKGEYEGRVTSNYDLGKKNTEIAKEYLNTTIGLTIEDEDEIDATAVGNDTDIPWLRDYIVWPQPGYDTWPPEGSGWVRHVTSYTEFAQIIDEQFKILFDINSITSKIKITFATLRDPNLENNKATIIITPKES